MNNLYQRDINHLTPQNVNIRFLIIVLILVLISSSILEAQEYQKPDNRGKDEGEPSSTLFNLNNISTWIYNNGFQDKSPDGDSSFEYPKGSKKHLILHSGLVWGGFHNRRLKVGGTTSRTGLQPGRILENGKAEDKNLEHVRIYKGYPWWRYPDVNDEAKELNRPAEEIIAQYEKDMEEWPYEIGAPYIDNSRNGLYEKSSSDYVGISHSPQTIWYVANDLDTNLTRSLYGSDPIGLELQATTWGYDKTLLYNTVFRQYRIINKSKFDVESMHLGMYVNGDIGYPLDDYAGCDSTLNLSYIYSRSGDDPIYDNRLPAIGIQLLKPIPKDYNHLNALKNPIELKFNSHYFIANDDPIWSDPELSHSRGTLQMYNILKGLLPSGKPKIDPLTGRATKFALAGDPVKKEGWVDGILVGAGSRATILSTDKITLAAGDTLDVVFAFIAEGYFDNINYLTTIKKLKAIAELYQTYNIPRDFNPYSNYGNSSAAVTVKPFDRSVLIQFDINERYYLNNLFEFEGYEIRQYNCDPPYESKLIATFDKINGLTTLVSRSDDLEYLEKKVIFRGNNSGIKNHLLIETDRFSESRLRNGSDYCYNVSTVEYSKKLDYAVKSAVQSPDRIIPQLPKPGVRYNAEYGDEIWANRISGSSAAAVYAFIVDPSILTGNEYSVTVTDTLKGEPVWDLKNESTNTNLLSEYNNPDPNNDNPIKEGFLIEFRDAKPLQGDKFTFMTPGVTYDLETEKIDVDKINIFPNPYLGTHSQERGMLNRFITFSHLPERAVIRIFNLAGQMVKKIERNSSYYAYLRWDLRVDSGLQIGPGVYIAHIEMPDLGKTKILKFSVIHEQFIPDRF
ncbi:MAG: hypothetical protein K9G44_02420 [Melioribacteraceae bacterium]|nr:hypothetical protein [Melioribacteraceae bacterium]